MRRRPSITFIDSILIGIIVGFVTIGLRFAFGFFSDLRVSMRQSDSLLIYVLWIVLTIGLAFLVSLLLRTIKQSRQSGETQVQAQLLGLSKPNSLPLIFTKIIGTLSSAFAGLSLGHGGPSMQIGAHIGYLISGFTKSDLNKQKNGMLSGQAAGLSAAFSAPIAATLFNFEINNKSFSTSILLPSFVASIIADILAQHVFGLPPLINLEVIGQLPLNSYVILAIMAVLLGFVGIFINRVINTTSLWLKNLRIDPSGYVYIAFGFSIVLFMLLPMAQGVDLHLFGSTFINQTLWILTILLIIKFFFTLVSFQSNAMGGLILPLMILGGLFALIFNEVAVAFDVLDPSFQNHFIIIGMATLLTATLRAPLFSVILVLEVTRAPSLLLPLALSCIIANSIGSFFENRPLHDILLLRHLGKPQPIESRERIMLQVYLSLDSDLDQVQVMNLKLPKGTLIISIYRYGQEINVDGHVRLHAGDLITLVTRENQQHEVLKMFH